MNDDPRTPPDGADADLEREVRAGRQFSLAEAIGRMAGPGAMKGASPVTNRRQSEAELQEYLQRHLVDAGGVLAGVLLRLVTDGESLLARPDQPLAALAVTVEQVLGSDYALRELVRQADVEWGRVTGERPHFDRDGQPPDPDDPYTAESVRAALTRLAAALTAGTL